MEEEASEKEWMDFSEGTDDMQRTTKSRPHFMSGHRSRMRLKCQTGEVDD